MNFQPVRMALHDVIGQLNYYVVYTLIKNNHLKG